MAQPQRDKKNLELLYSTVRNFCETVYFSTVSSNYKEKYTYFKIKNLKTGFV